MLIFETYLKMVLSSVNRNYLIMSDDEKVMSKYAFFEIFGNSLAAIFIIKVYGIVHYAFVKAMLTFVIHYMGAKRLTLKKLRISRWEYICSLLHENSPVTSASRWTTFIFNIQP